MPKQNSPVRPAARPIVRVAGTFGAVLATATALGLGGCATTAASPPPPPPPPQAEVRPLPPVSAQALVWQPGHWTWANGGFVWEAGRYVPAAGHSTEWQPGYWAQTAGGWTWRPAHWM